MPDLVVPLTSKEYGIIVFFFRKRPLFDCFFTLKDYPIIFFLSLKPLYV